MIAKKSSKTTIGVYGTKAGVLVTGADSVQVRKAMRLLTSKTGRGKAPGDRLKSALKFHDMAERFFKSGGRFKKRYTRSKKKAK